MEIEQYSYFFAVLGSNSWNASFSFKLSLLGSYNREETLTEDKAPTAEKVL